MDSIARFVIWICKKFNRDQIIRIIKELQDIIDHGHPEIKPKDDFKQRHPNYRDFYVDPKRPLDQDPNLKKNSQ